jgi:LCP family protein required for cell wall assembly
MRKQNFALWVILVIACGGLTLSLVVLYRWNMPLGPSLGYPTLTASSTSQLSSTIVPTISGKGTSSTNSALSPTQPSTIGGLATPQPLLTATRQPICNGPASMTFLVIGSDQRGTSYLYGLADSIYVAYIDFKDPKIMVIDFPRDLWVEIPGISDHHGITHGKINQAYLFGNHSMGYYDGPGEGPGLLARTLDQNFGLRVDHYLALDMQTFVRLIDTLGGVDIKDDSPIDLNNPLNTPVPNLTLGEGTRHLDGETALLLATNRIPNTFTRMKYQRMILSALREKLLSPEMIPQLSGLMARFIGSVQTDLSLSDINSLICLVQAVPKENIQAESIPQDMFTASVTYDQYRNVTTFIYEADFDELRAIAKDFVNGTWPFPEK